MIKREKTLWRQLDGPQISAVDAALWNYKIEKYDAILEYLDSLSIETANSAHLDFIGKLMGLPRAAIFTEKYFEVTLLFSVKTGVDELNAFSGFADGVWKNSGAFAFPPDSIENGGVQLVEDGMYRDILRNLAETDGSSKGLAFIDRLCNMFLINSGEHGETPVHYELRWHPRIPGDIQILIENTIGYRQIILQQILDQTFSSSPRISISLPEPPADA